MYRIAPVIFLLWVTDSLNSRGRFFESSVGITFAHERCVSFRKRFQFQLHLVFARPIHSPDAQMSPEQFKPPGKSMRSASLRGWTFWLPRLEIQFPAVLLPRKIQLSVSQLLGGAFLRIGQFCVSRTWVRKLRKNCIPSTLWPSTSSINCPTSKPPASYAAPFSWKHIRQFL